MEVLDRDEDVNYEQEFRSSIFEQMKRNKQVIEDNRLRSLEYDRPFGKPFMDRTLIKNTTLSLNSQGLDPNDIKSYGQNKQADSAPVMTKINSRGSFQNSRLDHSSLVDSGTGSQPVSQNVNRRKKQVQIVEGKEAER